MPGGGLNSYAANAGSIINYGETTYSATFSGPFAVDQVLTIIAKKINNLVMLEIPGVNATNAVGTIALATATTAITDAGYRPQASVFHPIQVIINGVLINVLGKIEITTAGTIKVYADTLTTGLFSALGNNGWQRISISYSVA